MQNVSPKLKLFLWKIANQAIPVGERLLIRHVPVDPLCKRCGEVETISHLFFQCSFSQQVWRSSPFLCNTETELWDDYKQAWEIIKKMICLPPTGIALGPLAPWICRNKLVFNDKIVTTEEALTSAIIMEREWTNAQQTSPPPTRRKPLRSRRPEPDTIICQSDVAWNAETKTAGLGWTIKQQGAGLLEQSKIETHMLPPHG
ncbi:unnamed protein product [Arabis nemorensis]|uniref:Reverse transcriptase zinc-binding domain-containing protein n=1 Tax=Arabis nemorensis TaxID=586526 RepID=A0A565CVX1_9BRAS|nr:unnamed protein product [Arabis nemorensis]